jgi:lipoprotein-anchoring transpeptidase ErfK/SrfK
MSRRGTLLLRLLAVLAVAALAFVARGVLSSGKDPAKPALPAPARVRAGSDTRFRAGAALAAPAKASVIATARGRSVRIYAKAGGSPRRRLRARVFNRQRIPLTFLVVSRRPGWLRVDLPTRPNQSQGWIRKREVRLAFTRMHIVVRVKGHQIELRDGNRLVTRARIALGKALSPTPHGRYFVTDVVRPPDPKGFYGPYALGLSAHSSVYTSFEGGDGQVGIHGTNQPSAIGSDVSHGCIRVRNGVITRLARAVPLGTPVTIRD